MNETNAFERFVADQFERARDTAQPTEPALDRITLQASRTHQRPRWLAIIKEPPMRTPTGLAVGSPTARVAAVMVATLLLTLTLAAAGIAGARLLAADDESGEPISIGFTNVYEDDSFFSEIGIGVRDAASEAGVDLTAEDAAGSPYTQAGQIDRFLEAGVDAIILVPLDPDGIVQAVERANAAGIPVVTVDRNASGGKVAAFVASDNVAGGKAAGDYLFELMGGTGKVYEIQGGSESSSVDRAAGFEQALAAAPGITLVAAERALGDPVTARRYTLDMLEADPGIGGLFAHNDDMALGAIEAIGQLGLEDQVAVVGFDAASYAIPEIRSGALAASIAQHPGLMGRTALETAVAIARGEAVDAYVPIAIELVTAENADKYLASP